MAVIIIGSVILIVLGAVWYLFTCVVSARKKLDEAWRKLEDELDRRHELLGPLVESIRSNKDFEKAIMEIVSSYRSETSDYNPADLAVSENRFSKQLQSILALGPTLHETDSILHFKSFTKDLTRTENLVQAARKQYNGCVKVYNRLLDSFPTNAVASKIEYRRERPFDIELATHRMGSAQEQAKPNKA